MIMHIIVHNCLYCIRLFSFFKICFFKILRFFACFFFFFFFLILLLKGGVFLEVIQIERDVQMNWHLEAVIDNEGRRQVKFVIVEVFLG